MIGGDQGAFGRLESVFQAQAPGPDKGYGYVGPAGAENFVKMIHNAAEAQREDPTMESLQAYVEVSGEGRWTVQESIELVVPAPVVALSLQARFRSRQERPFGARLLAALCNQFGGHAVRPAPSGLSPLGRSLSEAEGRVD